MLLSFSELLIASVIVFFASLVQSATGFGLAIIAAPLLYFIEPRLLPGPMLALGLVVSGISVWRDWSGLAIAELGGAVVSRIPGTILALWLLQRVQQQTLSIVLAASVLLAVAVSLTRLHLIPTHRNILIAGFASGFMGTSTSIGGPPMALIYQHSMGPGLRANLNGYFLVGSSISIFGLVAIGRYGLAELYISSALIPASIAGLVCARLSMHRWDRGSVRPVLLILCVIAGMAILVDALKA